MKRLFTVLALILVLCLSCAAADNLPYLTMGEPNNTSPSVSPESYPEICLSPVGMYDLSMLAPGETSPSILFPTPEGRPVDSFTRYSAEMWVDGVHYAYKVSTGLTPESFLKDVNTRQYVLRDEDGTFAVINASLPRAYGYGYLPLPELGETAVLRIEIYDANMRDMNDQQKKEIITARITDEVRRIQSAKHCESFPYGWSYGRFAGAVIRYSGSVSYDLKVDFPSSDALMLSGGNPFMIGEVDPMFNGIKAFVMMGKGIYADVYINMSTSEMAADRNLTSSETHFETDLPDGVRWEMVLSHVYNDETRFSSFKMTRVIPTPEFVYNNEAAGKQVYYMNVQVIGHDIAWDRSMVDMIAKAVSQSYTILDGTEPQPVAPAAATPTPEPEVPAAVTPAPQPEAIAAETTAPADGTWTCSECGAEGNTSKFCPECGSKKPQ